MSISPLLAAGGEATFPLLTTMVLVPAIGALVIALMPAARTEVIRQVGVIFAAISGAISIYVLSQFETSDAGFQFVSQRSWIADLGISWHVGIDGISLFLVVLTGLLFPFVLVAITPEHDEKAYTAWILLLMSGCMGVFVALDLFMFFVFFEIVLVPMYMLIGGWGHGRRVYAATKFFLYTMLGSALMLVALLALVFISARDGLPVTFDLLELAERQNLSVETGRWLFAAFAIAFGIKVPIFPLHTWLPDAHTEAPTAGSVILAGVMLKLGTYGLIRYGLFLFPEASVWFAPAMVTLGVIGIIYGAVVATMQTDLKRLVAYSSVAHLGFIVLGTFALTSTGIQGGVLQMVNHGISTGGLFLLVGMLYERRHTREIAKLRGIQKPAPIMAGVFTVVMLSSIGLPGLNGFVGEFMILIGSFPTRRWWTVVATVGVILAALYLLWAYQRVFHGEPDEENARTPDLTAGEMLVMAPVLAAIVFMGVYPKPVLERIEPAVDRLVAHVEEFTDFESPEVAVVPDAPVGEEHGEEGEE
ncbi:MAG: NADH-quinone oxidoreductase subunit M [Actinomycetota bacterium]